MAVVEPRFFQGAALVQGGGYFFLAFQFISVGKRGDETYVAERHGACGQRNNAAADDRHRAFQCFIVSLGNDPAGGAGMFRVEAGKENDIFDAVAFACNAYLSFPLFVNALKIRAQRFNERIYFFFIRPAAVFFGALDFYFVQKLFKCRRIVCAAVAQPALPLLVYPARY